MNTFGRKIVLALVGIMVFSGIDLYATQIQSSESAYSPEGAWICSGEVSGITFHWMDIYTSDARRPGVSGTILCTLPVIGMTQSGHGSWIRIGKNEFAFTVLRLLLDNGVPVGTAKFWGTVTIDAENHVSGAMSSQNYLFDGTPISGVMNLTFEMTRIEVEVGG